MADEKIEVEEKDAETTLSQEEKDAEAAKAAEAEKSKKNEEEETGEKSGEEVEISEMEKLEDGRFMLEVGNSKYFGKSEQEVISKALKGTAEKDKSYDSVVAELNKLKAESSIRTPEDEGGEIPPAPAPEDFISNIFKARGLDPGFAGYTDQDWENYKHELEEKEKPISDFALNRLVERVEKARDDARNQYVNAETAWLNRSMLRKDITPAVRDMVAESGLDADTFGKEYYEILNAKEARYDDGQMNQTYILLAMHKKVVAALKKSGLTETEIEKRKKAATEELEEKKRNLGGSSRTNREAKTKPKEPKTIREAFQMFDDSMKKGRI